MKTKHDAYVNESNKQEQTTELFIQEQIELLAEIIIDQLVKQLDEKK